MAASTLLLPFQPLMVSAVHTGIMEASSSKLMASYSEHNKRQYVICVYWIYIILLPVMTYPSFYPLSTYSNNHHLRFHLLNEHQQIQSSRRHITYTRYRLSWEVRYSSLMMSSHKLPTSMQHGIQLQRWVSAHATSCLSDKGSKMQDESVKAFNLAATAVINKLLILIYQHVLTKCRIRCSSIVLR